MITFLGWLSKTYDIWAMVSGSIIVAATTVLVMRTLYLALTRGD
jgi:hypothetical protein